MKRHYVQAVLEMISEGNDPEVVISGLVKLLEAKGHQALFAPVLKGVLRTIESKSGRDEVVVSVANTTEEKKYIDSIKAALKTMSAESTYTLQENKALIGGFVVEANNKIFDASHKTILVNLYHTLTK